MIVFISAADTELLMIAEAKRVLPPDFPATFVQSSAHLQTDAELDDFFAQIEAHVKIFIVRVLGGRSYFERGFARITAFCRSRKRLLIALPGDNQPDPELVAISNVPLPDVNGAFEYVAAGGVENYRNVLLFIADVFLSMAYGFEPPSLASGEGLYHPRAQDRFACAALSVEAFQRQFWTLWRPSIGILFYRANWQSGDLAIVDALIDELEANGCNVLPVFCYSLRDEAAQTNGAPNVFLHYFSSPEDEPTVDCIVSLLSYAVADLECEERVTRARGVAADFIKQLGVPIIQGIATSLTIQQWRESEGGIPPLDAAMKVVMPEFDGRIIGGLVGFRDAESVGSVSRMDAAALRSAPLAQRTRAIASLAQKYAKLRMKPNSEKKIVIMLTNFANRHGRVGSAVGLDTPASVVALLRALQSRGYEVTDIPPDGDALMECLIARGGYDKDFLTEAQMKLNPFGYLSKKYDEWFENFPEENRNALKEAWGNPPGTVYVHNGKTYVAGVLFGNVLVMIQPPRGFGENPLAVYHSGDLIPTHQYLGAYRWLRDEFGLDALIHCGKHGTLEWLPGKGLGLSEECYPEMAIQDIPVFYPFIINDPGEGTQAKRRMHACIIDHLVPPLAQAETYDELARLQQLLGTYANAERIDPDKLPLIQQEIWDAVVAANLHHDLEVDERPSDEEYGEFLQHIDGYLCEIGDMQIRDGLHILGDSPSGDNLVNLALALIRLDAPDAPGIRRALSIDVGIEYEAIMNPAHFGKPYKHEKPAFFQYLNENPPSRTCGDIMMTIETFARLLVRCLAGVDFSPSAVPELLQEFELPLEGATRKTLDWLAGSVVPNLRRTTEEISALLDGLEGRAVPAGPSGAPTRGMANILPTGRNFYSVDVRAIPSPFAWKVGCQLGNALLQHYIDREGRFPETVGMTIWGTSNMRTQGDDIAEIFWLMGVEPIWEVENRRIKGLKLISLEDLKHPRIDVTVRMSGFFRDAFPGVTKLLDHAVNLAADADEPEDANFIRKRVRMEEAARLSRGESPDVARRRSRFRLFSNQPGAYGAGVLSAISEQNWETSDDLARIYVQWGGFAYTNEEYGAPAKAEFEKCLADTDIAIQNQDNREHDIFDSDDYLQFHGGMIAAIRSLAGRSPIALFGDSSNPEAAQVRDIQDEARRVFRARVANPKWLRAIRRHGYKGALEMAATVDYMFGYDATANVIEDWMYKQIAEKYVFDETSREFLERSNPWALREMTGRLLEAAQRGMWENPDAESLERLKLAYLSSEGVVEMKGDA